MPSAIFLPSTVPVTPFPAGESKSLTGKSSSFRSAAAAEDRRRQGMFAAALNACRKLQDLRFIKSGRGTNRYDLRLAFGQRAGLVDDQRVDLSPCARALRRS